MLFASTPADKAILPTAWGGRYFFNRIGQKLPLRAKKKSPTPPAPFHFFAAQFVSVPTLASVW